MHSPTIIPSHMRINGRIATSGDLIIEGRCTGEIEVGGTVTIAAGAHCEAFVRAHVARVEGHVVGSIVCRRIISVGPGARLVGSIEAPNVEVHPGAQVQAASMVATTAQPAAGASPEQRVRVRVAGPGLRRPAPPPPPHGASRAAAPPPQRAVPLPPRLQGRIRVTRAPRRAPSAPGRSRSGAPR
jgi:cytoskeletal protein CcmA (bactofilin family)